jgi:hypothetical protein
MLVMFLLAALGSSIPQVDLNTICRSASAGSLPEDRVMATKGCVGDESTARDQLRRDWGSKYTAADKSNCAPTPAMQFSYVELLTCLQMQRGGNFGSPAKLPPPAAPSPAPPSAANAKP